MLFSLCFSINLFAESIEKPKVCIKNKGTYIAKAYIYHNGKERFKKTLLKGNKACYTPSDINFSKEKIAKIKIVCKGCGQWFKDVTMDEGNLYLNSGNVNLELKGDVKLSEVLSIANAGNSKGDKALESLSYLTSLGALGGAVGAISQDKSSDLSYADKPVNGIKHVCIRNGLGTDSNGNIVAYANGTMPSGYVDFSVTGLITSRKIQKPGDEFCFYLPKEQQVIPISFKGCPNINGKKVCGSYTTKHIDISREESSVKFAITGATNNYKASSAVKIVKGAYDFCIKNDLSKGHSYAKIENITDNENVISAGKELCVKTAAQSLNVSFKGCPYKKGCGKTRTRKINFDGDFNEDYEFKILGKTNSYALSSNLKTEGNYSLCLSSEISKGKAYIKVPGIIDDEKQINTGEKLCVNTAEKSLNVSFKGCPYKKGCGHYKTKKINFDGDFNADYEFKVSGKTNSYSFSPNLNTSGSTTSSSSSSSSSSSDNGGYSLCLNNALTKGHAYIKVTGIVDTQKKLQAGKEFCVSVPKTQKTVSIAYKGCPYKKGCGAFRYGKFSLSSSSNQFKITGKTGKYTLHGGITKATQ